MREHPTKRCDTCEFWSALDHVPHRHPEDQIGTCRRNAPHPTMGDHEYYMRYALVLIAPDNDDLDKHWEQAVEDHGPIWPSTRGMDWCGEWTGK